MVSCHLSVVRGRQSPECIKYTTFASYLNPWKTLEILAFLAAHACRATEMPAEAPVSRAKSYGWLKTFKNLGKTWFSRTYSIAPRYIIFLGCEIKIRPDTVELSVVGFQFRRERRRQRMRALLITRRVASKHSMKLRHPALRQNHWPKKKVWQDLQ